MHRFSGTLISPSPSLNPFVHTFICCMTCKVRSECQLEELVVSATVGTCIVCLTQHFVLRSVTPEAAGGGGVSNLAKFWKLVLLKLWRSINSLEHMKCIGLFFVPI